LPSRQRVADAKLCILDAWDNFHGAHPGNVWPSIKAFIQAIDEGGVSIEPWALDAIGGTPSPHSLFRWLKHREDGLEHLAGDYGNRRGSNLIDTQPAVRDFVLAFLADHPHAGSSHFLEALGAHFALDSREGTIRLPGRTAVKDWLATWKRENPAAFAAMRDPAAYRNSFMPAFGDMREGLVDVNQLWEMDGTPADVLLADGRHTINAVIDAYTLRMKLLVTKTPRAQAVKTLMRRAFLAWGVPGTIRTDNGSDYVNADVRRVLYDLRPLEHDLCTPGKPYQKPFIERGFRTFQHGLIELLPAFCGHNPLEAKAVRERRIRGIFTKGHEPVDMGDLTQAQLQEFCDRWAETVHYQTPSGGLGGKTPFQVLADWRGTIRTITDERKLDVLMAVTAKKTYKVTKNGVSFGGAYYIAPELGACIGRPVGVLFDPEDLGRIILKNQDDQFVCIAECPTLTGISQREIAVAARVEGARMLRTARDEIRDAQRRANIGDIVGKVLDHRAEQAEKLVMMPKPTIAYDSEGLQVAGEIASALDAPASPPPTEEESAKGRAAATTFAREKAEREAMLEDPKDKYRRLYLAAEDGEPVSDEDRAWLERIVKTSVGCAAMRESLEMGKEQREASRRKRGK